MILTLSSVRRVCGDYEKALTALGNLASTLKNLGREAEAELLEQTMTPTVYIRHVTNAEGVARREQDNSSIHTQYNEPNFQTELQAMNSMVQ